MEQLDLKILFSLFGFLVVTGLVSWLLSKVYEMDRRVTRSLELFHKRVENLLEKERGHAELANKRADVLDESVGEISDYPFNSKHVAEGKQPSPTFRRYRKLLSLADGENGI